MSGVSFLIRVLLGLVVIALAFLVTTRIVPGIQVHGGMGFTWENDLHLYYRRAKASETMLGDATFHRERIAANVIDGERSTAKQQPELAAAK